MVKEIINLNGVEYELVTIKENMPRADKPSKIPYIHSSGFDLIIVDMQTKFFRCYKQI